MQLRNSHYSLLLIILLLVQMSCEEESQIKTNHDCKLIEQIFNHPSNLVINTKLKYLNDGVEIGGITISNSSGVVDTMKFILILDDRGRIVKNCAQSCSGYYWEFVYSAEHLLQLNRYNNNVLLERWDLEYNVNNQVVKRKKYYTNEGSLYLVSYLDLQYTRGESKNPASIISYDVNGKMLLKREFKYDDKRVAFYKSYILSDNYGENNPIQIIHSTSTGVTQTIKNTYEYNESNYPVTYSSIVTYSNGTSYGPQVTKYIYDCK